MEQPYIFDSHKHMTVGKCAIVALFFTPQCTQCIYFSGQWCSSNRRMKTHDAACQPPSSKQISTWCTCCIEICEFGYCPFPLNVLCACVRVCACFNTLCEKNFKYLYSYIISVKIDFKITQHPTHKT